MTERRARLRFQKRLEQGLSHAGLLKVELASALGVRDATVSTWFQADPRMPEGATIMRLPEVLGVDGHWLLTGQGSMAPREPSDIEAAMLDVCAAVDRLRASRPVSTRPNPSDLPGIGDSPNAGGAA